MSDNTPKHGRRRAPKTAWQKGQSGNPGGRKKVDPEVSAMARAEAPAAFRRLVELSKSRDLSIKLRACEAVIDRAYGRPGQSVEHTGPFGGPITVQHALHKLSEAEILTLREILAKAQP